MKVYVQFYDQKLDGKLDESMGSDGVFHLDQRLSLSNQIERAKKRAIELKQVQPNYLAFRIMRGERYSNARPLTELIELN